MPSCKYVIAALGLLLGLTSSASAGHTCHACYGYHSVHRFGWQCNANLEIRIPCCLDSTCDMYQHHAYYPECHGSYYFRPYNWEHYAQDTALGLGLEHAAPYSEDSLHELKPTVIPPQPVIHVRRQRLPNVEDLIRKPMAVVPQAPALPKPPEPAK